MLSNAFRDGLAKYDTKFVMGTGRDPKTTCRLLGTTEMQQGKRYSLVYRLWLHKASGTGSRTSKVEKAAYGLNARV
jgi:hypothetical protein